MEPGRPCWIDLSATSADERERLTEFLCGLFGWAAEFGGPETGYYTMLIHEGAPVAAVGQQPEGMRRWITYLATADMCASLAKVAEQGGSVAAGPHTVFEAGTLAVATDPTGAAFGLWQADRFHGFEQRWSAGNPVWFDHGSPDPARAVAFYTQVFGLQASAGDGDAMVGPEGQWQFSVSRNFQGNAPDFKPVIMVADLAAAGADVIAAGGAIYAEGIEVPGGFATTFADPVVNAPLIAFTAI